MHASVSVTLYISYLMLKESTKGTGKPYCTYDNMHASLQEMC